MPVLPLVYAQPAESDSKSDYGNANQYIGSPGAKIRKGSQDEKQNNLDSETVLVNFRLTLKMTVTLPNTITQQYNTIYGPVATHEMQPRRITSSLIQEILECRWGKIKEAKSVVADVVAVICP